MKKYFKKIYATVAFLFFSVMANSHLMAEFSMKKQGKGVFVFNLLIVAAGAILGYLIWRKKQGSDEG